MGETYLKSFGFLPLMNAKPEYCNADMGMLSTTMNEILLKTTRKFFEEERNSQLNYRRS